MRDIEVVDLGNYKRFNRGNEVVKPLPDEDDIADYQLVVLGKLLATEPIVFPAESRSSSRL